MDARQVLVGLRKGPVASLSDLRGRTLASPGKDAPAAVAIQHLAKEGLEEEADYTVLHLTEENDEPDVEVLRAVLGGRAEVGLLDAAAWDEVVAAHRVPKGAFQVLWTSPGEVGA